MQVGILLFRKLVDGLFKSYFKRKSTFNVAKVTNNNNNYYKNNNRSYRETVQRDDFLQYVRFLSSVYHFCMFNEVMLETTTI